MRTKNKLSIYNLFVILGLVGGSLTSCEKFVELGPPPTQTVLEDVFKTDATATSAILSLYSAGLSGLTLNYSVYPGMSADDLKMNTADATADEFKNNAISVTNGSNANSLWFPSYTLIKNANNAISGLTSSTTLTPAVKDQLMGEAKFMRAFAYFHLVNFYGDVPLVLTDYSHAFENASLPRTAADKVWAQIIADLEEAQTLLPAAYTGTFRARVNKWAASSLLARAYLYTKEYAKAEAMATQVIDSKIYSLPSPANAFVNNSNEIILQAANTTGVSAFGGNYLAATGQIPTYILNDTIYKSFQATDLRKTNWTGIINVADKSYYFVNKYKVRTGTGNEYNVVLRFAELYLIRAEARVKQNKTQEAKTDVESVRTRAGLGGLSSTISQAELILAIEQERKLEFFGEWGHRWFDLKRTNRADEVVGGQKTATWNSTDVLYPIPDAQRLANPNLSQNPGYN